ncbi:MAG: CAP domain-containing protein [Myxococcales bacterium]|nr:CAP domain-containing protein [Myxococcales bacterium]
MKHHPLSILAVVTSTLVFACESGRSRKGDASGSSSDDGADGTTLTDVSGLPGDDGDGTIAPEVGEVATATAAQICERWNADRQLTEGEWTGSVLKCDPGDIDPGGRANALRLLNLYRWLAGLPAVTNSAQKDAEAQACALMMHANLTLSHNPSDSWSCYTKQGAEAAGQSNISTQPGVASVDAYMIDDGNDDTIGHRRWILSNGLGPVGLGSTSTYSCMHVIGGLGSATAGAPRYTAWPPAGKVPLGAFYPETMWWANLDQVGWTVQSDRVNVANATVTVTSDGETLPVDSFPLLSGYGSESAVRFTPKGWQTEAGKTYTVSLSGVTPPITYTVEVLDCGGAPS